MLRATPGRDPGDCHVARGGRLPGGDEAMVGGDGSARSVPGDADSAAAVIDRLPPRLRGSVEWASSRWPGRIVVRSLANCIRIELFDRSDDDRRAVLHLRVPDPGHDRGVGWPGGQQPDRRGAQHAGRVPERTERRARRLFFRRLRNGRRPHRADLGDQSLARTHRAFADIWMLPRPRSSLASAWRWLAVVLCLALSLIAIRALGAYLDASQASTVALAGTSLGCDLAVALFVPWILLSGIVAPRSLVPGALLFAIVMLVARPASAACAQRRPRSSARLLLLRATGRASPGARLPARSTGWTG